MTKLKPKSIWHGAVCAVLLAGWGACHAQAAPLVKKPEPAKERRGEQVYVQSCAVCHGAQGEGGKGYKKALLGDLSPGELARYIAESMPPNAKKKLPADEARRVADYIYGAFYSVLAQEKFRPARVELSHLTVRQYRNAVTDLVGSFRGKEPASTEHGLRAKYFATREGGQPVLERVDAQIAFDFGVAAPAAEQTDPYQFVMHWTGSVYAPETGDYDVVLRTDHSGVFWLNDLRKPLIDARIKSGKDTEYRATLRLLAGRSYPIRLEFYKGVSGEDRLKKLKEKPVQPAMLSLEWKPPKHTLEPIPQRFLFPAQGAQKFVLETPFPPDDRSTGFERGTTLSREWDDAATEAALEVAGYVAENLGELSGVKDDAKDRDTKLRTFCRKFVSRAFRAPLSEEQAQFFVERQFGNAPNAEAAVKRVVLLALKSPRFLYRELETDNAAYGVASRLAFALWDSLPDEELLTAATKGELSTAEQISKQATRMAGDRRAWAKLLEFLLQWLKVEQGPDLTKDKRRYPDFDEQAASDLRASLEMTLEDVVWSEKSDFRKLMLTDEFYLNGRLAKIYGEQLDEKAPFTPVKMDGGQRAGVLTHPYILSSFAYLDGSSPIHRGVLISRNLLGRALRPPPEAVAPIPAELNPKLTTRQRVDLQTKPASCASCHSMINPLGFSLEAFDATGELRSVDNGVPVDSSGSYVARDGRSYKFANARDLAEFLAGSDEVHAAFSEKLFQYMVKQPVRAYGPQAAAKLREAFEANQLSVRRLMIDAAVLAALGKAEEATPQ